MAKATGFLLQCQQGTPCILLLTICLTPLMCGLTGLEVAAAAAPDSVTPKTCPWIAGPGDVLKSWDLTGSPERGFFCCLFTEILEESFQGPGTILTIFVEFSDFGFGSVLISQAEKTYNALINWLTEARMLASQNIVIILCGNKKDLDTDREITFLEASRSAQENELMFLETSTLTGENVEEAFVQCARKILNKIESGELDPERMCSGIQYGDAALRQLRSPHRAQAQSAQKCGC
ncbi:ras-related protein Rab-4A-like [Petaurus breviceps papuanus]|uniref:ras-related protein Rab-4A-like n=1 Tax=Petaurus breviceps papuanus TaxID=3040969 RepID=UPI0036DD065C